MGGGGKGGGGSQPSPPNYQALIGQQGAANYGQWLNQTYAGRPNQANPYGSTTWTPPPMPAAGAGGPTATGGYQQQPVAGAAPQNSLIYPTGSKGGTSQAGAPGTGPGALFGGAVPAPTGQWGQSSSFSPAIQGVVNPSLLNAGASASSFNPAANPTFSPANVAGYLYGQQMNLLEPGMQSQSNALDQSLKAQGYDVNQSGGAQTAENNLMNQQNLLRSSVANAAAGQAIPQGAQALAAEQSTQLLPLQEAGAALNTALSPASTLPGGAAQTPAMAGIDVTGPAQQSYANQVGMYNANQANQANMLSGLMGLGGAGLLAYGLQASDARAKTDIIRLGRDRHNIGIFGYRYKWDRPGTQRVGAMAQDVERTRPDAVFERESDGMKFVNYDALGV